MSGLAAETRADRASLGIAMCLVAWMFFAATDTSVKWLVLAGLPPLQLAFMRYAVSFGLSLIVGWRRGVFFEWAERREMALVLLRALLLIVSTGLNFVAIQYLPLSVTSSILTSAPIVLTALAVLVLGERVGLFRWGAVIAGFIGVLIIIRPFGDAFHWATLLMLLNVFCMSVFAILTRRLSGTISTQTMQTYIGLLGTVTLAPFAISSWTGPTNGFDWALMVAIGFWAWFGHEIYARAHAFAEASVLTPFSYAFIIYLTLSGYLIFGTVPDSATLIGATIVVASGLVIWWREHRQ